MWTGEVQTFIHLNVCHVIWSYVAENDIISTHLGILGNTKHSVKFWWPLAPNCSINI